MSSNAITNWLLGIFSAIIVSSVAYFGNKVNEMDAKLSALIAVYNVELPNLKSVDLDLRRDIQDINSRLYNHQLTANKREEEY